MLLKYQVIVSEVMPEPVVIVDYDPNWTIVFARLRGHLEKALGSLPVAIEHIGSTSIPGAAAKPIIDIDIVLRSSEDQGSAIQALAKIGYRHVGDKGISGREAFDNPPGLPAHHLYAVIFGNREYTRQIRFRNYLRYHPEKVQQYSTLKRALASKFRNDREAYTEAKTSFIEEVLRLAAKSGDA
jgi:GrpB-like predicted nucleotidyltransferase (UPF0157 family)